MFRVTDILSNGQGDRIRAHVVFVVDLKRESVRVDKSTLVCI